jgi:hypothetical protein
MSLREKQAREVLDVWQNLHSQVSRLQNKQVSVFTEGITPKTQRDLGAEVNVDKSLEQINRTLETKLGALEEVVSYGRADVLRGVSATKKAEYEKESQSAGDIIALWNNIVRAYQQPGLSKQSQDIILTKIQVLTPNLDAMQFGLQSIIDIFFSKYEQGEGAAKNILSYLRANAIYKAIALQIEMGKVEILSKDLVDNAFKLLFNALTQEQREELQEAAGPAMEMGIQLRPLPPLTSTEFQKRVAELEEELGFNLPSKLKAKMRAVPTEQLEQELLKFSKQYIPHETAEIQAVPQAIIVEMNAQLSKKQADGHKIKELHATLVTLEQEIDFLRSNRWKSYPLDHEIQELPEVPIEPQFPQIYFSGDDEKSIDDILANFTDAVDTWREAHNVWAEAVLRRNQIEQQNELLEEIVAARDDVRQIDEEIENKVRQFNVISSELVRLEIEVYDIDAKIEQLYNAMTRVAEGAMAPFLQEAVLKAVQTLDDALFIKQKRTVRGVRQAQQEAELEAEIEEDIRRAQEKEEEEEQRIQEQYMERRRQREAEARAREAESKESEQPAPAPPRGIPKIQPRQKPILEEKEGDGKPLMKYRGLASLKKYYGHDSDSESESESESDSDKDVFDFDDSRNEMYASRPKTRK